MESEELYKGINNSQSITQEYFGLTIGKFLLYLSIVVGFGVYIGSLLYGNSSLAVMFKLQEYEAYLKSEIYTMKQENASLQKEYFELKEISTQ